MLKLDEDENSNSKVNIFLNSIGRNSSSSKKTYATGLNHFNRFITQTYDLDYNSIITNNLVKDPYKLLDSFITYLQDTITGISPRTVSLYITAVRSYFEYNDIDVLPSKFKRKVKMPKISEEDEEPIDVSDVRKILLACNTRRLKPLLLTLASGGMRVIEGLAIRNMDIDFTLSPTKIHIRKEYTKTKRARDIYISDEATEYLKKWLDWKYNNPDKHVIRIKADTDLVFTVYKIDSGSPRYLYKQVNQEFNRLLASIGMDDRKEGGIEGRKRRKITIHSFRRYVKTIVSDEVSQDYSEWFLGHRKSSYWTKKEPAKREIYNTKAMKYLTFLDYTQLETTGKNIEAKLNEKDLEIQYLRQRDLKHETEMQEVKNDVAKIIHRLTNTDNTEYDEEPLDDNIDFSTKILFGNKKGKKSLS